MSDITKRHFDKTDIFGLRRADNLLGELDRVFDGFGHNLGFSRFPNIPSADFIPATDVVEGRSSWYLRMEVPGLAKDAIKLSIQRGNLIISGEKKCCSKEYDGDSFCSQEIGYGVFRREFTLPDNVSQELIRAKHKDGILTIRLPKRNARNDNPVQVIEIENGVIDSPGEENEPEQPIG